MDIFDSINIKTDFAQEEYIMLEKFMDYLTRQIDAAGEEISALEADGRRDDANFVKVRQNIYDVCRTVTNALTDSRVNAGTGAVAAQFERFRKTWGESLEKAREHGDAREVVVGETKMEVLEDVVAHFREEET